VLVKRFFALVRLHHILFPISKGIKPALTSAGKKTINPNLEKHQKMRNILQLAINGNTIGTYCSSHLAAKATGILQPSINKCLNRKLKTAGGYRWIYEDEHQNQPTDRKTVWFWMFPSLEEKLYEIIVDHCGRSQRQMQASKANGAASPQSATVHILSPSVDPGGKPSQRDQQRYLCTDHLRLKNKF
jgi:hypothetical protein